MPPKMQCGTKNSDGGGLVITGYFQWKCPFGQTYHIPVLVDAPDGWDRDKLVKAD